MKRFLALLLVLVTTVFITVGAIPFHIELDYCGSDLENLEVLKSTFTTNTIPNYNFNGGAFLSGTNQAVLLDPSISEAGTSFYSVERVDLRGGLKVDALVSSTQIEPLYQDTAPLAANRNAGFAFVMQDVGSVTMGSAGAQFGLGSLQGGLALVIDTSSPNTYCSGCAVPTNTNGRIRIALVKAANKSSPTTVLNSNLNKAVYANLPGYTFNSARTIRASMTFIKGAYETYKFTIALSLCNGLTCEPGTPANIALADFSISGVEFDRLFPSGAAHVGLSASIGSCTKCPSTTVKEMVISGVHASVFYPQVPYSSSATRYTYQASGALENVFDLQLRARCRPFYVSGEWIDYNVPSMQVTQGLAALDCNSIFSGGTSSGLLANCVKYPATGKLKLSFSYKKVGDYTAIVRFKGDFKLTMSIGIYVGLPSPARSSARSDSVTNGGTMTAGVAAIATVTVRDAYDNIYTPESRDVAAVSYRFGCCSEISPSFAPMEVIDGQYRMRLITQRATNGLNTETIEFKVSGTTIFTISQILVLPDFPLGSSSSLSGDGLTRVTAGDQASIFLSVGDTYSNLYVGEPLQQLVSKVPRWIEMSVQSTSTGSSATDPNVIHSPLVLNGPKTLIEYKYKTNVSGTYSLRCRIYRQSTATFTDCFGVQAVSIDVRPKLITAEFTNFPSPSLVGTVGTLYSTLLTPRDEFQNQINAENPADRLLRVYVTAEAAGSSTQTVSRVLCSTQPNPVCAAGYNPDTDDAKTCTHTNGLANFSCIFDPSGSYRLSFTPLKTAPDSARRTYAVTSTLQIGSEEPVPVPSKFNVVVASLEASNVYSTMSLRYQAYTDGVASPETVTVWKSGNVLVVPGDYTGTVCKTKCLRAGTDLTITYTVLDAYGNAPSQDASQSIYTSATARDFSARAAELQRITMTGSGLTHSYTQQVKLYSTTVYTFAITIGGEPMLNSVGDVKVSSAIFSPLTSTIDSYSREYWYGDHSTGVNSWNNVYVINPFDAFSNKIYFDALTASYMLGALDSFGASYEEDVPSNTPVVVNGSFLYAVSSVDVTMSAGEQDEDDEEAPVAPIYTVAPNTIYINLLHTYPTGSSSATGKLTLSQNAITVQKEININFVAAITKHASVFYKAFYPLLGGAAKAPGNFISTPVYMMVGHNSFYSDASLQTKLDIHAVYFNADDEYVVQQTPSFVLEVSQPSAAFSTRSVRQLEGENDRGQGLVLLEPSNVFENVQISISSGGIKSRDTQNSVFTVSTIHGVPSELISSLRGTSTVIVAGEGNINLTLNLFDTFSNQWLNKLGKEYKVDVVFKTGDAVHSTVSRDGSEVLTTNSFTILHDLTIAGDYTAEASLTYTALDGPVTITFQPYSLTIIGDKIHELSTLQRCDTAAWVCTAGQTCAVCFTSVDAYGNKAQLTQASVSAIAIKDTPAASIKITSVSLYGDQYRIMFTTTRSGLRQSLSLVLLPTAVQDSSKNVFVAGNDELTVLPSSTSGSFSLIGTSLSMGPQQSATFSCKAFDVYGNPYLDTPQNYKLSVSRVGGTPVTVSGAQFSNGIVTFAPLSLTVAGQYHLQLSLEATFYQSTSANPVDPATGVAYPGYHSFTVRVGEPSPRATVLTKLNFLDTIRAGQSVSFSLTYYDIYKNKVAVDDSILVRYPVSIQLFENKFGCISDVPAIVSDTTLLIDQSSTTYTVSTNINETTKAVDVSLNVVRASTVAITNLRERYYVAPFVQGTFIKSCSSTNNDAALGTNFVVGPNVVDPSKTIVQGTAADLSFEANTSVPITLVFADQYGNLHKDGFYYAQDTDALTLSIADETTSGCSTSGAEFVKQDEDKNPIFVVNTERGTASFTIDTVTSGSFQIPILATTKESTAPSFIQTCIEFDVHSSNAYKWKINLGYYENSGPPLLFSNTINKMNIFAFDISDNIVDPAIGSPYSDYRFKITMRYVKTHTIPSVEGDEAENASVIGTGLTEGVYTYETFTTSVPVTGINYDNVDQVSLPYPHSEVHVADINPAWPGIYYIHIEIDDYSGLVRDRASAPFLTTDVSEIRVVSSNCFANDGVKQIFCKLVDGDMGCAATWSECEVNTCAVGQVWFDGACVDESSISCPALHEVCETTGLNEDTIFYCAPTGTCEDTKFIMDKSYRNPIGFVTSCSADQFRCSDGKSCVYDVVDCPAFVPCAAEQVSCSDGSCARSSEECSTRITCPADKTLVAGVCVDADDVVVYTPCIAENSYRCPDGSCRSSLKDCPSSTVCPVDTILCDSGFCAFDLTYCQASNTCASFEIRCPDGACALDISFCGSKVSCPAFAPVLCADGTCVDNLGLCKPKPACPASRPILCPDKSCALQWSDCPTPTTCHPDVPVKCFDGSCASSLSACPQTCKDIVHDDASTTTVCEAPFICPNHVPVLCSDGSCRKSNAFCPIFKTCPASRPIRCVNDECVFDASFCPTTLLKCAEGYVRCRSGQCVPNLSFCSTVLTCPSGQHRCVDGTCRFDCSNSKNYRCPSDQVMCPLADAGFQCATSLAHCPQSIVCPASAPVRCLDMYCAGSAEECNLTRVAAIPPSRVPCGNGFWSSSFERCGTPVTCPAHSPIKCWDQSCRRAVEDCPEQHGCPLDTPFLCGDGSCVLNPWSCAMTMCPSDRPVRCPSAIGSASSCVESIDKCPNLFNLKTPAGTGKCVFGQRCWNGACSSELRYCPERSCPSGLPYLCDNGTCAKSALKCPTLAGCPWDLPYFCKNTATCVASEAVCGSTEPIVCSEGLNLCADGSCRSSCNVSSFGCSSSTPNVCADKQCVASPTNIGSDTTLACIGLSDTVNACPAARPFRCPGGYCATSSSRCPVLSHTDSIWSSSPTVCRYSAAMIEAGDIPMTSFCDDGSCAYSQSQCPIVKPCEKGYYRCGDGTCREPVPECTGGDGFENPSCRTIVARTGIWSNACPNVSTCPPSRPYRCQDGLCVADRDQCIDDYPVILNKCCGSSTYTKPTDGLFGTCNSSSTSCTDIPRDGEENQGCPKSATRCANGMCVFSSLTSKFTQVTCDLYDSFLNPNGCAVGMARCANGECVANSSQCPLHNGCSPDTPFRCDSGFCVESSDLCAPAVACEQSEFKCPSGQCVTDVSECKISTGCSADKPIRCSDGQCRKFAASYFAPADKAADYCPLQTVCDALKPVLCADGTCAASSDLCRPVSVCAESCAIRCPGSLKCIVPEGAVSGSCPSITDEDFGDILAQCGVATTCPPNSPFLCPDGSCKKSISECTSPLVSSSASLCPASKPIRCWTGKCVSGYSECIWATHALFNRDHRASIDLSVLKNESTSICPDALNVCPNGLCVEDLTTCEVAMACPAGTMRCEDGSCAESCTTLTCSSGLFPCVDGTCRQSCPMFFGCPVASPFFCPSKKEQCVANKQACEASPMLLDDDDDDAKQEVCETNCDRDVTATAQTILLTPSMPDISIDVSMNADGAVRTRLLVPSSSFNEDVIFSIQPVPSVFFDGGVNAKNITAPFTMLKTASTTASPVPGDFAKKVLSSPFRCSVTDTTMSDRLLLPTQSMTYSASVDTVSYETTAVVSSDVPCEMIGYWDAATIIKPDNLVPISTSKKCVGTMTFTSDSFSIGMEDPTCDYDFSMAGSLSSKVTVVPWGSDKSDECLCFKIVDARGDYVNILGKDLCMRAQRVSLGLQVFFEEGFKPTLSGSPDLSKLGSCTDPDHLPPDTETSAEADISAYLIRTNSVTDPCSYANTNVGNINKQDICLGTYTSSEVWECARDREGRIQTPSWTNGMHEKMAVASIDDCTANAYAFIYSALPPPDAIPEEEFCWWCNYGKYVLGIGISFVCLVIIALIALSIVSRNRAEYKKEQAKLNELQSRAKELDEYAGGLGIADEDGEVVMVANPLVLQMQELQKQLDMYNQQMDTQGKHEEYEIQRLEMQRQRIKDELLRIQQELEKQNVESTKPQRLDAAPRTGHVLSMTPAGPVAASGPVASSGPVAASGPMSASGPTSFGAGPSGPVSAPRKARDM